MRVLVTGGFSDIGRAIVERRLEIGDTVLVSSTQKKCGVDDKSFSRPVEVLNFDLFDPQATSKVFQEWAEKGIGALILNAASRNSSLRFLHEYDANEIKASIEGDIFGNIWLLQRVLAEMARFKFGRIVYISSMAVNGAAKYGLYAASKGAIESVIKNVAIDYGEFNITANIIRPGVIETARTKRFWKRSSYAEIMQPLLPLMRFGQPMDIAKACDYFLDLNCYSTGTSLDVAGGMPAIRPSALFKVGL